MTKQITVSEREQLLIKTMREKGPGGLHEKVIDMIKVASQVTVGGIKYYHTYDSRKSVPGFPDIVMVFPATGRVVVAELKRQHLNPTDDQKVWLDAFLTTRAEVYVWRPAEFYGGQILAVLMGNLGGEESGRWEG